jgi:hypothetical protein
MCVDPIAAKCASRSSKSLTSYEHGVKGSVGVTSSCKVNLKNFSYDGKAPSVYLWYTDSGDCSPANVARNGKRLSKSRFSKQYVNKSFRVPVLNGIDTSKITCIAVYCEQFSAVLGATEI